MSKNNKRQFKDEYVTQNVQVRKDLMIKVHMLKIKDGATLAQTFDKIFEYYFKHNDYEY